MFLTIFRRRASWFRCLLAAFCIVTVIIQINGRVSADETRKLELKINDKQVTTNYKRVPDDARHVLALTHRKGNAQTNTGEKAEYTAFSLIDAWVGQKGFRIGYSMLTFGDGSTIFYSWTADSKRNEANLPSLRGTGELTKGTGKFKGVKGNVAFNGVQNKSSEEDPSRARTTQMVVTYTLP